ncbi:hypothetical protein CC86DRAFT_446867 [Ophiobolus disseminans]|uniref:Uncharacterized protein n=1 Tax=Ophiobolus disseminans TaxID=1469910 RepID=A0A6A6ZVZ1_9PLEO|nr:hypothetical protein CC86DRAFT_446867 [Ophiobolus disseminans]
MTSLPLTPSSNPSPDLLPQSQPTVDFSPATVPYNEAFENDLMNLILHPPENVPAPTPSAETPMVPASQLPIPLSSSLRTHPSPIPGLHLTHADGYHTGGPGPSPQTVEAFAQRFMREHGVSDEAELQDVIREVMAQKMGELRGRMLERERAVQKNREVDEELDKLRLQRDAEVRVLEKMKGRR